MFRHPLCFIILPLKVSLGNSCQLKKFLNQPVYFAFKTGYSTPTPTNWRK
ncbi:hypothetical protein HWC54_gp152 [Klebsiella phage Marfa]|uniref:Uncharacterized protein n=1 Tax=Klebsiella phage Marfa TaxID=2587809 RepID=A0A4Y5TTD3_9CAUD|nr:hypothetical protein HWC54_gp152 [Klebsiella phage Marfa]QDB71920.1 hypothetical protein CPT_Marfa_275 [Klebsiella phage Marfa]